MSNPWYAALSGLKLPIGNAPRELPAWQLFHTLKADVVTMELTERGLAMNDIGTRNKVAKELFDALQLEEQVVYQDAAKARLAEEIEQYRRELEGVPRADPAEHAAYVCTALTSTLADVRFAGLVLDWRKSSSRS